MVRYCSARSRPLRSILSSVLRRADPYCVGHLGSRAPRARKGQVERRQHKQGEQRADQHAGGDGQADTEARVGAGAAGDHQRYDAEHGGEGGHKNGPQAQGGGLQHRVLGLRWLCPDAGLPGPRGLLS